jgi:hypothetical protein
VLLEFVAESASVHPIKILSPTIIAFGYQLNSRADFLRVQQRIITYLSHDRILLTKACGAIET